MSSRKSTGFTLIELLVVIAIIAVLAAILFPVFTTAKERANQSKCLNNLKQLATAVTTYRSDSGGKLPFAGAFTQHQPDWCGCNGTGTGFPVVVQKGSLWPYTKNMGIYKCGTDRNKKPQYGADAAGVYELSYTMNCELDGLNLDTFPKRLSQCLLFIHESVDTINDGLFRPSMDAPSNTHYDGTTVAYADGHVVWKKKVVLDKEKADLLWTPSLTKYQ